MNTVRVIPCLDVKGGRVVKGVNFVDLQDAGDPVEMAAFYADEGADELVFLDIGATVEGRQTFVDIVEKISARIDIPFTVGGGIKTIQDIDLMLQSGAEKISLGSAAVRTPELVREASQKFGNQCIVISVDPKWNETKKIWEIYVKGGRENTGINAIEFAQQMVELGAGELLVNSLDRDGTKIGYDNDLLRAISTSVSVPVIASSGAGKLSDFMDGIQLGKADAVLAASLFHSGALRIKDVKQYLCDQGCAVRL
jgi:cyclase